MRVLRNIESVVMQNIYYDSFPFQFKNWFIMVQEEPLQGTFHNFWGKP